MAQRFLFRFALGILARYCRSPSSRPLVFLRDHLDISELHRQTWIGLTTIPSLQETLVTVVPQGPGKFSFQPIILQLQDILREAK